MIKRVAREGDEVVCVFSGIGEFRVNVANLTGSSADKAEKARAAIQQVIDVRILLSSLPSDDPDKTTDPARLNLFWSDSAGSAAAAKTHLCARPWAVTVAPMTYELTFTKTYVN